MREQTVFITSDGKVHNKFSDAHQHANIRYGEALTKLAHELARMDKYKVIVDWLDENQARLAELAALKADMILETDREGE
jgi:hypothetical protein